MCARILITKILFIWALMVPLSHSGQQIISWDDLSRTHSTIITRGENKGLLKPMFPESVRDLDGVEVIISGYIVPVDVSGSRYALSRFPLASCFFCGNAGPETVMELNFSSPIHHLITDTFVTVKGVFMLNDNEPHRLFFILENCSFHG